MNRERSCCYEDRSQFPLFDESKGMSLMGKIIQIVLWCMIIALLPAPAYLWAIATAVPQSRSFEFHNESVSEALQEISKDFDIAIYAPFDKLNGKMTKSYKDASFETIIRDMMRWFNHAVVWYYKNQKIVAIEIQLAKGKEMGYVSNKHYGSMSGAARGFNGSGRETQTVDKSVHAFSNQARRNAYAGNQGGSRRIETADRLPEDNKAERAGRLGNRGSYRNPPKTPANQSRLKPKQNQSESSPPPPERELPERLELPPSPPGM